MSPLGRRLYVPVILLFALAAYVMVTYRAIAHHASLDESRPVDAIVVFGAAEYGGRPSPVLRARLDHALSLYSRRLAPFVITTGGQETGDMASEGSVGRAYLVLHGVPDANVIAETQSADTAESAERVARIMRTNGMNTCLAVSDGYHIYRIEQMMARQGIVAYGAPRPSARPSHVWQRPLLFLRETLSLTLWRLHLT